MLVKQLLHRLQLQSATLFFNPVEFVTGDCQLPDMQNTPGKGRPRNPTTDDAIFEATISLLLVKGLDATTIDAVASQSGVTRPTVYRRYKNKQILIEACVEKILREDVAAPKLSSDPRENVIIMMINTIDMLAKTPVGGIFRVVIPHLEKHPKLAELTQDIGNRRRLAFKDVLLTAQQSGVISSDKNIDFLADGIIGALYFNYLVPQRILNRRYVTNLFNTLCE